MTFFEMYGEDGVGPSCRVCGCDEMHACPGGCVWAEPDLCSRCARADVDGYDAQDEADAQLETEREEGADAS